MKIVLGSTSIHKLYAVREACRRINLQAEIVEVKTNIEQNEQPVGLSETFDGALARARAAFNNDDEITIGIESGILTFDSHLKDRKFTFDIAVIVVLTNNHMIMTTSSGVVFPEWSVDEAQRRSFTKTTVGSIITEKIGGDPADPHSVLTDGRITRASTLIDALVIAFKQI